MQRFQIGFDLRDIESHIAISFLHTASESLRKPAAGGTPARAIRFPMQPVDQTGILPGKSLDRLESGFLFHVARTAFERLGASYRTRAGPVGIGCVFLTPLWQTGCTIWP